MRKGEIAALLIVLLSFAIGIYFYNQMPEQMPSHWNAQGQVDSYLPKFWVMILMPIISVALFLLYFIVPRIDPLKYNIEKFRKYFDGFVVLILLFLLYIYLIVIFASMGMQLDIIQMLVPALALIFFYCGILIGKAKRNWFIGIRTPWTMSSEQVWDKTHKRGGKLFMIAGIIALLGLVLPAYAIWIVLVPIILAAIYVVVYSYVEYRKEIKAKQK